MESSADGHRMLRSGLSQPSGFHVQLVGFIGSEPVDRVLGHFAIGKLFA